MKKKIVSFLLVFVVLISCAAVCFAGALNDVPKYSEYYEAVQFLSEKGVLSGYEDGSFRPENLITRAETAAVIVRAAKLDCDNAPNSVYSDVPNSFWGRKYIMAASKSGIINGMGDGMFAPNDNVTYNQIIKMVVCMLGVEADAQRAGGWPLGYSYVASSLGIIDNNTYRSILNGSLGNEAATRGKVAKIVYGTMLLNRGDELIVNGEGFYIGMDADDLGTPDEVLLSVCGFDWYVFGTETYKDFFAAGVDNGKVVMLISVGLGFEYSGCKAGDVPASDGNAQVFMLDKNDGNKIHGVLLMKEGYDGKLISQNKEAIAGESKINFHCTNAFRVMHGLKPLGWSEKAAASARLHSEDMAKQNYFDHTSPDGRNPGKRMEAQGINWNYYAENIAAGRSLGVKNYDGWVNSSGHRKNMLGKGSFLGVGGGFSETSDYGFYYTQNFYAGN